MESNTSTPSRPEAGADQAPAGLGALPAGLEGLAAAIAEVAAGDPNQLGDALLAERVLALCRLGDQLDAAWLRLLAAVDARGAAGAELGTRALSTAGWLRATVRMSPTAASQRVRTARALHRGPLAGTAAALAAGLVSSQHAAVLADTTRDLPAAKVAQAEPVLVDAARRLDPGRLRQLVTHLRDTIDPDTADQRGRARLERRGLWLATTFDGMVAVDGLLDPEAGEAARAALAPLARPTGPDDDRNAAQRRADALGELARQALQAGRLPQGGGQRPQLTVTIELASLLADGGVGGTGAPGGLGGVGGVGDWGGTLPTETVRRLACDATVTRAVVHRHPASNTGHGTTHATHDGTWGGGHAHTTGNGWPGTEGHASLGSSGVRYGNGWPGAAGRASPASSGGGDGWLAARLRGAVAFLPPPLGAPTQLLDLGRATRVITPALRRALALRDGGCIAAGCDRPAPWTDAHHLDHWLHGGPTSLDNLVLLCRTHHRAIHEGGLQLARDPVTGQPTLAPPTRHHPSRRPPHPPQDLTTTSNSHQPGEGPRSAALVSAVG